MNICFYCKFNGGGTERATANLAKYLTAEFNVFMLSTCPKDATYPVEGVCMDHLECPSLTKQIINLSQYLKEKHIDVLISLEALSGITAIPAAKMSHCKLIIWEHANYYQNQGSKYTTFLRKIDLLVVDAYVLLTKRDLDNFRSHFRFNKNKVKQIYNIVEYNHESNYNIESKTIISVGHINRNKNFIIIPDIAKIVFSKYPDWKWIIYGETNGNYYERLRRKVEEYNLGQKIIFPGFTSDIESIYGNASIYVMTSFYEGLPMVLLEAKSYSLPVLSFDIETGPDEIILDGVNGYLIKNRSIDEMSRRIMTLIESDKKRLSFSENAKNNLHLFSGEAVAKEWKALLCSF